MAFRHENYRDPASQLERIQLAAIRRQHRCSACIHGQEVMAGLYDCKKGWQWPKQGTCYGWSFNEKWKPPVKEEK